MRDEVVGRGLRALRHRMGWRQRDVAAASGVSRSVVSDLESGRIGSHSLNALRDAVASCGGVLRLTISVPGGDLHRLLDADHAALQARWKHWLERHGWVVEVEVTFNHYGERGSIDLLAWDPFRRVLLVVEIKTVIVDVQHLLASIDRRTRVAGTVARARGWRPAAVVPALFVLEGSTARRRVAEHASLFGRLALRGAPALRWLRRPDGDIGGAGILCFTSLSPARRGDRRRAGRQRVRVPRAAPRSNRTPGSAPDRREPGYRRQDRPVTAASGGRPDTAARKGT